MRRIVPLLAAVLLFAVVLAAQNEPKIQEVSLTGTLRQAAAIGGETTGWSLDVSKPLWKKVGFKRIELDPKPAIKDQFKDLADKEVEVTGTLTWREGVERGRYQVLIVKNISRMEKMPVSSAKPKKDQ